MEPLLKMTSAWAGDNGPGVNPEKIKLMLFTTKSKVLSFGLPTFEEQTLFLSKELKYLGIILDSKLV